MFTNNFCEVSFDYEDIEEINKEENEFFCGGSPPYIVRLRLEIPTSDNQNIFIPIEASFSLFLWRTPTSLEDFQKEIKQILRIILVDPKEIRWLSCGDEEAEEGFQAFVSSLRWYSGKEKIEGSWSREDLSKSYLNRLFFKVTPASPNGKLPRPIVVSSTGYADALNVQVYGD